MRLFMGFFISCWLSSFAFASIETNLQGTQGIDIQGQQYSLRIVELLHQSAARDQSNITLPQTAELIIENHLLANQAIQEFGEKALLQTDNRVGFPDRYLLEMQYLATAEYLYKNAISATLPKQGVSEFIKQSPACNPEQLTKLLSLGQHQEFQLTDAELTPADQFSVLSFQFPERPIEKITLGSIYRQQNVQGRISLHSGDCQFLKNATNRQLGELYVNYWMETHSGLSEIEIQQLQLALRMRYIKDQYLAKLGIAQDVHDDSDYVVAKSKTIRQSDIVEYYNAHRDQFKRVTKARGRHLRVTNQAAADKIYSELVAGLDFDEAIVRYSQDPDKNLSVPGSVDWVYNTNKTIPWRDTLFLIFPMQQINRPVKAPYSSEWEFILVDKREEEYQAANSEGVRYQVAQILARQKIAKELQVTRQRLYANNLVRVNPALYAK